MPRPPPPVPHKRLNMLVPAPLWQWITEEAERIGITVSEFVRRVLDEKRLGRKGK